MKVNQQSSEEATNTLGGKSGWWIVRAERGGTQDDRSQQNQQCSSLSKLCKCRHEKQKLLLETEATKKELATKKDVAERRKPKLSQRKMRKEKNGKYSKRYQKKKRAGPRETNASQ